MQNLTLITGGARSGKSLLAEKLGKQAQTPVLYFATMHERPDDAEQCRRIERHRSRRPPSWQTIIVNGDLSNSIDQTPDEPALAIVDCLSLYVADYLMKQLGEDARGEQVYECEDPLLDDLDKVLMIMEKRRTLRFVVVTNEVGSGVVPESVLGRAYRDLLGAANQLFAARADHVYLMCSGLPLQLKPSSLVVV